MKTEHKAIMYLIEEYLEKNGEHLRFWQALYNMGITVFDGEDISDDYNISDQQLIERINQWKKKRT